MRIGTPDKPNRHSFRRYLTILVSMVVLVACSNLEQAQVPESTRSAGFSVDPAFRDIYKSRGGSEVLGDAISPLAEQNGNKYQFTENALFVSDPNAPPDQRIYLAPVGKQIIPLEERISQEPPPAQADPNYVNGVYIFPKFRSLYDRLGGSKVTGKPLTPVRYNSMADRYEQYFENVGFYVDADGKESAGLLAYGAWVCGDQCNADPGESGILKSSIKVSQVFKQAIEYLNEDFTGSPLVDAYTAADGRLEQVFANLVLANDPANPTNPDLVSFRPLTEKLGYLPAPMTGSQPGAYFYEVENGQGYNIPNFFKDYLDQHGGFAMSGAPIGEISQMESGIQRQCYRNLCLDYDPVAPEYLRIRPAPLGMSYLQTNPRTPPTPTGNTQSYQQLTAQVWESFDTVASNQEQEIWASVSLNGKPVPNIRPVLVIYMPDGSKVDYELPPTGEDGRSSFHLPPIVAANATLIPYDLCIPDGGKLFCYRNEYLILNSS